MHVLKIIINLKMVLSLVSVITSLPTDEELLGMYGMHRQGIFIFQCPLLMFFTMLSSEEAPCTLLTTLVSMILYVVHDKITADRVKWYKGKVKKKKTKQYLK